MFSQRVELELNLEGRERLYKKVHSGPKGWSVQKCSRDGTEYNVCEEQREGQFGWMMECMEESDRGDHKDRQKDRLGDL